MVEGIRAAEVMRANPANKDDIARFKEMRVTFQKSITATVDIPRGTIIKAKMLSLRKPGSGLAPEYYQKIIGKKAKRDIPRDSLIYQEDIEW